MYICVYISLLTKKKQTLNLANFFCCSRAKPNDLREVVETDETKRKENCCRYCCTGLANTAWICLKQMCAFCTNACDTLSVHVRSWTSEMNCSLVLRVSFVHDTKLNWFVCWSFHRRTVLFLTVEENVWIAHESPDSCFFAPSFWPSISRAFFCIGVACRFRCVFASTSHICGWTVNTNTERRI